MSDRFLSHDGCFHLTPTSKEEIKASFAILKKEVDLAIDRLSNIDKPSWENLVVPFYNTQILIEHFAGRFIAVYVYSASTEEYQETYGEIFSDFSEIETKLLTSTPIISKISSLISTPEYQTYEQEQKNYIRNILNKAQNLCTLDDEALKNSISAINNEIAEWSQVFNTNIQKATQAAGIVVQDRADLGDVPEQWLTNTSEDYNRKFKKEDGQKATPHSGPWYISLTSGAYEPFMEYSRNRELKKDLYIQKRLLASSGETDNTDAILKLISKRNELAKIRGFKNFLENSLEFTTAKAPQLEVLCTTLTAPLKNKAQKQNELYRKAALQDGIESFESWDLALYERLHKESLGFNKKDVSEYFPYIEMKQEIFKLFEECFSMKFKEATHEVTPWHPDVQYYRAIDNDGTELGGFYIDPYQRAGEKIVGTQNLGAFCGTLRESSFVNGQSIRPVGILSFGFAPPTKDTPSLCQPEEVGFFFHEFGHLLSILFKKQSSKTISPSFYLENDTIEFESMVLESWAKSPYVLKRISKHYKTGESLSDKTIEMLKDFLSQETDQRAHGLLSITKISLALYSSFNPTTDDLKTTVNKIVKDVVAKPTFEDDQFVWGCTPLFTLNGYLANTYMYLWAMTVAHTYLMEIESTGWNDESVKKFGQTMKTTLYRHAAVGMPMHALKLATGKELPDFEGFALSRINS